MAWKIEGRYFENCSCDAPCPCTVSMDLGATLDHCNAFLVFHVDSGEIEGVDVAGRTVAAVIDSPKLMTEGNWRLGLVVDDGASDEQMQKLVAVFGGDLGGPMEALGPLVGEVLGATKAPVSVSSEGGTHRIEIGDDAEMEVQDIVPFGKEDGQPVKLSGIFHPAGEEFTIAKSTTSRIDLFGVEFSAVGKSGFSSPFAWAA